MNRVKQLHFFDQSSTFKIAREEFKTLLGDKLFRKIIQVIFFILALNFLLLIIFWIKLPPLLPLFYSRPWGENQLVAKNFFPILPISCLLIFFLNLRFASIYFKKELLLSQILIFSSLVICILTSISLVKILIITL